jgi:hypothetical protein
MTDGVDRGLQAARHGSHRVNVSGTIPADRNHHCRRKNPSAHRVTSSSPAPPTVDARSAQIVATIMAGRLRISDGCGVHPVFRNIGRYGCSGRACALPTGTWASN